MHENLAGESKKIHDSRNVIISMLKTEREFGCRPAPFKQAAADFSASVRNLLGEIARVPPESDRQFSALMPFIENAYIDWKALHETFLDTSRMAYQGTIPAVNLNIDAVHAELERTVGEPLGSVYALLQAKWKQHVGERPWDSFMTETGGHIDEEELRTAVLAIKRGDDFDVEDATEQLTGPLRHLFSQYLDDARGRTEGLVELQESLWKRPEIIIANDYWRHRRRSRIIDTLASNPETSIAGGFARVQEFFGWPTCSPESHVRIADFLGKLDADDKEKFLRCFAMHPDRDIRRYAVTNVNVGGFWKSLTPVSVPCATLLSLLEQLVGSSGYDENMKKIFFDSVYRRLHHLTSRSEVMYARGIARIFMKLDLFLEDRYFEKLIRLLGRIEAKEAYYNIKTSPPDESLLRFKHMKSASRSIDTPPPDFSGIPPVVLRKLARDGHFWLELSTHPRFKIARETIPYINSRDRAMLVASRKNVNQDVLRAVGKNKQLFSTQSARLALLSNPRTPPAVSLEYLPDLARTDIEMLMRKSTIHPEFRQSLYARLRVLPA
jgi:hypothetical protein